MWGAGGRHRGRLRFYIYNRLQAHLAQGEPIVGALEHSILEVGMATIFTAITLAIGGRDLVVLRAEISGRHGQAAGVHVSSSTS